MSPVFEQYAVYAVLAGLALVVVGALWLLARAFRHRSAWLSVLVVVLGCALAAGSWLAAPRLDESVRQYGVYALFGGLAVVAVGLLWFLVILVRQPGAWKPGVLILVGALLVGGTLTVNRLLPPDLGPYERVVDGQTHLTLTKWDRNDYSLLQSRPQTVVLQMANPDVTDATLEYLKAMPELRELDVSDSKVTDEGLAVLGALPKLETLWLKRLPGVTDEGFRKHLLEKTSLRKVDVTGTDVKSKTLREWKKANPERDYVN
jgi:hypothetical protein